MELNINLIINVIMIALVIAIITRYTTEGIKNSFKIESPIFTHALIILCNAAFVWWLAYSHMALELYDIVAIFLMSMSGAEFIHKMLCDLKNLKAGGETETIVKPEIPYEDNGEIQG